jgi:hypothetical protein
MPHNGSHTEFGLPPASRSMALRIRGHELLRIFVYSNARRLRAACEAVQSRPSSQRPLGAVFPADRADAFAVMLLCRTHLTAEIIAHECLHVVAIYARKYGWRMRNRRHEEYIAVILGHLVATIYRELGRTRRRASERSRQKD